MEELKQKQRRLVSLRETENGSWPAAVAKSKNNLPTKHDFFTSVALEIQTLLFPSKLFVFSVNVRYACFLRH